MELVFLLNFISFQRDVNALTLVDFQFDLLPIFTRLRRQKTAYPVSYANLRSAGPSQTRDRRLQLRRLIKPYRLISTEPFSGYAR